MSVCDRCGGAGKRWNNAAEGETACAPCHGMGVRIVPGHTFIHKGIPYRVNDVQPRRFCGGTYATKVHAVNATTGLGGRYIDLRDDGSPFLYSPD